MKIEEINIEGKNVGFKNLSDDIFSLKPRKDIIQSVLDWQKIECLKKQDIQKVEVK
jgi:large subunit ribosomal protein L4